MSGGYRPKAAPVSGPGTPPITGGSGVRVDEYDKGYREGFMDAIKLTQPKDPSWPSPPIPIKRADHSGRCHVCNLNFKDTTLYCCQNPKCPTLVTW